MHSETQNERNRSRLKEIRRTKHDTLLMKDLFAWIQTYNQTASTRSSSSSSRMRCNSISPTKTREITSQQPNPLAYLKEQQTTKSQEVPRTKK
ncbi:hypothetical protein BRADI_5g23546v3 [Brachypodium distachyon]|uniref:Uncharacterized protein n=1 Tax=Brachypodium distachyon TaxID=15368 RepID=A0A0Q3EAS4_BRADI|nr:hypothetical protein BRADI_5g23546v3 [Brachypodium distachyon]